MSTAATNAVTLPFPPSLNHALRHVGSRVLVSRAAREYKRGAETIALSQGMRPFDGQLAVILYLYRPARRGDIDNYAKVLFDALKGIAWHDDSQVKEMHTYLRDDKRNPRAEIIVTVVPDPDQQHTEKGD